MPDRRALVMFMALCVALTALGGCASAPPPRPAVPFTSAAQVPHVGWVVVDPRTGQVVDDEALAERVAQARVIFVGESHDQLAHHRFQAAVVGHAQATGDPVIIGLEMFTWQDQPALDAYSAGAIDAAELRDVTDWEEGWGMPWELYAPLLGRAEAPGVWLRGLNAPKGLSRRVFEEGPEGLTDEERALMPPRLDTSNDAYRAFVLEALMAHHGGQGTDLTDDPRWEAMAQRFFQAQLVWDETMADQLTRAVEATPEARVVVAAGSGHVRYGWGVPDRFSREAPGVETLRIVCAAVPPDADLAAIEALLDPALADLICLTQRAPRPASARADEGALAGR